MKKILPIILLIPLYFFVQRQPILKTKIGDSDFYYKDALGFVYVRHSSCGFIGGCSYSDVPVFGTHIINFRTINYPGMECLNAFGKTGNAIYFFGEKQPQIKDPSTFQIVDSRYAKDSKAVYHLCDIQPVGTLDPNSFVNIGSACYKDNTSVYCASHKVEGADAASFMNIWRGYSRDKTHIYFFEKELTGVDPETFQLLSWGYFSDKQNIYYMAENEKELTLIENADRNTFKVLSEGYAQDSQHKYLHGKVVAE